MPKLIEFYNENADDNRFEIIAFHDASVKDFVEYDTRVQTAKDKYWDGEDLPFPVLLDATKATITQYGISAFPTMVLFDPEGRLVGKGSLDLLKEALKGEVETPEPLKVMTVEKKKKTP